LFIVLSFPYFQGLTRELTDFLPWQWARAARLTGQKVRSDDWFAPQSGAGLSGGLTQVGQLARSHREAVRTHCSGARGFFARPLQQKVMKAI